MTAATSIADVATALGGVRGPAPVHLWHPAHCGDIDIRIRRDGVWLHEGVPIARERLVALFASVLRRDPDGFVLVTPAEKLRIVVDDAPFVAVRVDAAQGVLRFTTNLGDVVEAGADHALRVGVDPTSGEPAPYVHVRGGLEARLSRPVFYEVVDLGEVRGDEVAVASGGMWFSLGPAQAA